MTRRRFFAPQWSAGRTTLTGEAAHHLAHVLRVCPGQLYELSDQRTVWLARITSVSSDRVEFELVEPISVPLSTP
ncbi:MAG: RNA methyltransferase PUA domain-containing protein [Terriglobia bacterium]